MNGVMEWSWPVLLVLGAGHGINPGMGWLFAVALGLQENRARAVWRALSPLALGHALAIAGAVVLAVVAGRTLPLQPLRWVVAGALVALGLYRLVRHTHPRWGGMRVGTWDLTMWSFLMASAHGAGLMIVPFLLGHGAPAAAHHHATGLGVHTATMLGTVPQPVLGGILAVLVHTTGYLLITGCTALIVYHRLGLRRLRTMWVNLDLIWAVALMATAVLTVVLH